MTDNSPPITPLQYSRTIEKTVSTPAVARQTAHWALKSATGQERGSWYAFITARMFTVFMVDGVIHHLGEKFHAGWNTKPTKKKKSPSWERLDDRHKLVRRALGLPNNGKEYLEISRLIKRLASFRNQFAHPKEIRETMQDTIESPESRYIPNIAWEHEVVDLAQIEQDFLLLEKYCIKLVDHAADFIEDQYKNNWLDFYKKYPEMVDAPYHASLLRGFLFSTSTSSSTISLATAFSNT